MTPKGDEPDPDDDEKDEPEGSKDSDEEYEDIPDELVAAGRQAGYSDEEIIDLDKDNPAVLEALARAHKAKGPEPEAKAKPEPKPEPDKKPDPKPESLELKFDLPGLDDELSQVAGPVQEAFNKLLSRVSQLESGLGETQDSMAGVEKGREAEMFRQVDVFFDNQAEQLPELGNSSKFDQDAVDARMYAWNIANDLMTGSQGKIELKEALQRKNVDWTR